MSARTALLCWAFSTVLPIIIALGALFKLPYWPTIEFTTLVVPLLRAILMGILAFKVFNYKGFQDFLNR